MSDLERIAPSTSFLPAGTLVGETPFTRIVGAHKAFDSSIATTGPVEVRLGRGVERSRTLEELQQHPLFGRLWQAAPEAQAEKSPVEIASDHRLSILARKYEGTALTREDEARVAILTQRLRRLVPRVTTLSWTIAEESVSKLEQVSKDIDDISAKYGL